MKYKNTPLKGTLLAHVDLPGDKSLSHRALMFAALAHSPSRIFGLNSGEDVEYTKQALQAIGINWTWHDHTLECHGRPALWLSPCLPIYLGNSGTSARLLTGLMAALPIQVTLTGDASLSKRPMDRVVTPLTHMGAHILTNDGHHLPLKISGTTLRPCDHVLTVPSAQIKSALLLAGLQTPGRTTLHGALQSRDHTEKMMAYFDIPICVNPNSIQISGPNVFQGKDIFIPADPSAAAFFAVGTLITPGSHIKMTGILWNTYRCQVFHILSQMGGNIRISNERTMSGEVVVDLEVATSQLVSIETSPEHAPSLIDEFPILSIAAACAQGKSTFRGLAELRLKESDRLHAIASNLQKLGFNVDITGDDLHIYGQSSTHTKNMTITTFQDHRIAMSFAILNLVYPGTLTLDDDSMIKTSFPNFNQCLEKLLVIPEL